VPLRAPGTFAFSRRRVRSGRLAAVLLLLAIAGAAAFAWLWPGATKPRTTQLAEVRVPMPPAPPPTAATKPVTAVIPPPPAAAAPAAAPAPLMPPPPPPARDRSSAQPLLPAPDPALVEKGPQGVLPIIGRDGRQPWRVYGRPFDRADKRPRVAIIITGLGPSGAAAETAINDLPGAITLAFDPYSRRLGDWIDRARAAGHEVLLSLPMEPIDYPRQDPGPYTLLTSLSPKENLERLDLVLSRVSGYVGVTTMMGGRFTTSQTNLLPVLDELKRRGLMFVDARGSDQSIAGSLAQSLGLPEVAADAQLDAEASRDAIDHHLQELEADAQRNGAALGIGFAYPATLERVALWTKTLEQKGIALAPASALASLPAEPSPNRRPGAAKGAAK
jgi:polysaccharide deacetylase 2 family uncharacterized protein YibQ